ncbi:MAG TPA: DUF3617 family protein [Sphingobium sp.]|nr:DUF3617 family protein [Sphingobium sp.]
MIKGLHILCGAFAAMTAASPAASLSPAGPLKGLEPGEWELRERGAEGEPGAVRKLCLADLRQLIQIRHPRAACKGLTVDDSARRLSVSYDCGGSGGGRTDLRIETPRLVQIRSQGVAEGAPFSFAMEGRRIGACR